MFWETVEYRRLMTSWNQLTAFDVLGLSHDERAFTRMIWAALSKFVVGERVSFECLRGLVAIMPVRYPVRSVQVTGEGNDARVAISMENGHTCLYQGDGRLIRA